MAASAATFGTELQFLSKWPKKLRSGAVLMLKGKAWCRWRTRSTHDMLTHLLFCLTGKLFHAHISVCELMWVEWFATLVVYFGGLFGDSGWFIMGLIWHPLLLQDFHLLLGGVDRSVSWDGIFFTGRSLLESSVVATFKCMMRDVRDTPFHYELWVFS